VNIVAAMSDPALFGPSFQPPETWAAWGVFLRAAFGLTMSPEELAIFRRHTGRSTPPRRPCREAWTICGRRAGKSRVAAAIATYLAAFKTYRLAPGETGVLMVIACDKTQARVVFAYVRALLGSTPMLAAMVVGETAETITLKNGVRIEVRAGNYRSVRGVTLIGCVLDEVAFLRDETSAMPDVELYRALKPALATVEGGVLIGISTPYSRRGLLYEKWKRHFGKDGDTLVWTAPSQAMNPTLPAEIVAEALADDEAAARAEWLGEFRSDLEAFVSREVIEACTVPARLGLPPMPGIRCFGFTDPSGGGQDSFTVAVAHVDERHGQRIAVLDSVSERRPPFSPEQVAAEYAAVLKSYGVTTVQSDRYAGQWPVEVFAKHGITVEQSAAAKSDLYRELLPLLHSGRCELLDHPRLHAQLLALERRVARGGRDSIDHPPTGHDDVVNSAAGALVTAAAVAREPGILTYYRLKYEARQRGEPDPFA